MLLLDLFLPGVFVGLHLFVVGLNLLFSAAYLVVRLNITIYWVINKFCRYVIATVHNPLHAARPFVCILCYLLHLLVYLKTRNMGDGKACEDDDDVYVSYGNEAYVQEATIRLPPNSVVKYIAGVVRHHYPETNERLLDVWAALQPTPKGTLHVHTAIASARHSNCSDASAVTSLMGENPLFTDGDEAEASLRAMPRSRSADFGFETLPDDAAALLDNLMLTSSAQCARGMVQSPHHMHGPAIPQATNCSSPRSPSAHLTPSTSSRLRRSSLVDYASMQSLAEEPPRSSASASPQLRCRDGTGGGHQECATGAATSAAQTLLPCTAQVKPADHMEAEQPATTQSVTPTASALQTTSATQTGSGSDADPKQSNPVYMLVPWQLAQPTAVLQSPSSCTAMLPHVMVEMDASNQRGPLASCMTATHGQRGTGPACSPCGIDAHLLASQSSPESMAATRIVSHAPATSMASPPTTGGQSQVPCPTVGDDDDDGGHIASPQQQQQPASVSPRTLSHHSQSHHATSTRPGTAATSIKKTEDSHGPVSPVDMQASVSWAAWHAAMASGPRKPRFGSSRRLSMTSTTDCGGAGPTPPSTPPSSMRRRSACVDYTADCYSAASVAARKLAAGAASDRGAAPVRRSLDMPRSASGLARTASERRHSMDQRPALSSGHGTRSMGEVTASFKHHASQPESGGQSPKSKHIGPAWK